MLRIRRTRLKSDLNSTCRSFEHDEYVRFIMGVNRLAILAEITPTVRASIPFALYVIHATVA